MKKFAGVFLVVLLVCAALSANAQTEAKFWIGGGATVLLMNGTGSVGNGSDVVDFDISASYLDSYIFVIGEGEIPGFESMPTEIGLNWGNNMMFGIKPAAGVKFNDQFGISAAYAIYFKKSSDESASGTDEGVTVDVLSESEFSMKSMQLLFQYYPSTNNPGLYLLGGLDMVSLDFQGTTDFTADDPDVEADLQSEFGEAWSENDSTSGIMFGVGYDFSPQEKLSLFGAVTYSLAKYDDTKLLGGDNLELKVGGLAAEIGVKIFLGSD